MAEVSPKTAGIPRLGSYVMGSMVLALLNFAVSCILLRMYHASPRSRPPPQRLARFLVTKPHVQLQTLFGMAIAGVRAGRQQSAASMSVSGQSTSVSMLSGDSSDVGGLSHKTSARIKRMAPSGRAATLSLGIPASGDRNSQDKSANETRKLNKWAVVREGIGLEAPLNDSYATTYTPPFVRATSMTQPTTVSRKQGETPSTSVGASAPFCQSAPLSLSASKKVHVDDAKETKEKKLLGWKQLSHHITRLWNTCFLLAEATLFVFFMVPLIRAWLENERKTSYLSLAD